MNYHDFLARSPDIACGAIVMCGTRVPLRTVLASLAEGDSFEDILAAFPTLTLDHLRAAVSVADTDLMVNHSFGPIRPSIGTLEMECSNE